MVERTFNVLALELRTFANIRCNGGGNSWLVLTRALFANNHIYKQFLLNSRAQGISGKNELST